MVGDFKLLAKGKDITEKLRENLINLSYTDKEGSESDEMSFSVHGIWRRAEFSDQLELWLGEKGQKLYKCGSFALSECEIDYLAHTTSLRATAVNFGGSGGAKAANIKQKRSRTWANTTLAAVANKIAAENGLSAKVQPAAAQVVIAHELQDNLSDIEFLYRLCFKHNFLAAIKNNTLIITAKTAELSGYEMSAGKAGGGGEAASGAKVELPKIALKIQDCYSLIISENTRAKYASCEISAQNTSTAKLVKVRSGSGEPVLKVAAPPNTPPAELASLAAAKLSAANKGSISGRLSTAGAAIRAGARLELENLGTFSIKSATHNLDASGYVVDVDFEG